MPPAPSTAKVEEICYFPGGKKKSEYIYISSGGDKTKTNTWIIITRFFVRRGENQQEYFLYIPEDEPVSSDPDSSDPVPVPDLKKRRKEKKGKEKKGKKKNVRFFYTAWWFTFHSCHANLGIYAIKLWTDEHASVFQCRNEVRVRQGDGQGDGLVGVARLCY